MANSKRSKATRKTRRIRAIYNQDNVRKLLLDLFITAGLEKEQAEKIIDEEWSRPLTNKERCEIDIDDSKVNLETWYHRHKKKFV